MTVTLWNRVEPAISHADPLADLDVALAAQVADPLWLLARQEQLGELRGEDAGTPILARVTLGSTGFTELSMGADRITLSPGQPLEPLIEAEAMVIDVRARVSGGRYLLALLEERGLTGLTSAAIARLGWPVDETLGPEAARLVTLTRATCPDGARIAATVRANDLARALGVDPTSPATATLVAIGERWLAWWTSYVGVARDAWSSEQLAHDAQVHTGVGTFSIAGYRGGRLDWDAWSLTAPLDTASDRVEETSAVPVHLGFAGAPATRFWELEDPRYDLNKVTVGLGDVGSALLVETALTYASDWFILPLSLERGSVHRVERLEIIDTFSLRAVVPHVEQVRPNADWTLWRVDGTGAGTLLIPEASPPGLQGEAIEEVAFLADELANLAWAIERIVPSELGRGLPTAASRPVAPAPIIADWRYQPMPSFPADRIPLARISATHLARATSVDEATAPVAPSRGRLITPQFVVRRDAIGRLGAVVVRRWQVTLDRRGGRIVWRTREVRPGGAQAGAHLAADALQPREP